MKIKVYKTKDYKAEVKPILLSNELINPNDEALINYFQQHFFSNYDSFPSCFYSVMEKLDNGEEFFRGYIFNTRRGWGFIARIDLTPKMISFYPSLDKIPFSPWQKSPSSAVKKLIHCSKVSISKKNYQYNPTANKHYTSNTIHTKSSSIPFHLINHCEVLNLKYPFTEGELKQSYRKLCFKHHSDTGDGDSIKLSAIYKAYKILKATLRA